MQILTNFPIFVREQTIHIVTKIRSSWILARERPPANQINVELRKLRFFEHRWIACSTFQPTDLFLPNIATTFRCGKGRDYFLNGKTSARRRTDAPNCDRDLVVIALKCLSKSTANRYASAHDLVTHLERWQRGKASTARAVGKFIGINK